MQERRAGFPPEVRDFASLLEYELFIVWRECEEQLARAHQARLADLVEIMTARAQAGL